MSRDTVPVKVGEARGALAASAFVTVVENDASFPRAVANSFRVSSAPGAEATRFETAVPTNAVVAIWVVEVPAVAVGAVGVPVKSGEASGAFASSAVCVAVDTGLLASEVLSTEPSPTIDLVTPPTVPVNVGLAIGA